MAGGASGARLSAWRLALGTCGAVAPVTVWVTELPVKPLRWPGRARPWIWMACLADGNNQRAPRGTASIGLHVAAVRWPGQLWGLVVGCPPARARRAWATASLTAR